MIVHRCPKCDAKLDLIPELAGKLVACGGCGVNLRLPAIIGGEDPSDVEEVEVQEEVEAEEVAHEEIEPEEIEEPVSEEIEEVEAEYEEVEAQDEIEEPILEEEPAEVEAELEEPVLEEEPVEVEAELEEPEEFEIQADEFDEDGDGEFEFVCPSCEAKLQAGPEDIGVEAPCPACEAPLFIERQNNKPSEAEPESDWQVEDIAETSSSEVFDDWEPIETEVAAKAPEPTDIASVMDSAFGEPDSEPEQIDLSLEKTTKVDVSAPVVPAPKASKPPTEKPSEVEVPKPVEPLLKTPKRKSSKTTNNKAFEKTTKVEVSHPKPETAKVEVSEPLLTDNNLPTPKQEAPPRSGLALNSEGELKVATFERTAEPRAPKEKRGKMPLVILASVVAATVVGGILLFLTAKNKEKRTGVVDIPTKTTAKPKSVEPSAVVEKTPSKRVVDTELAPVEQTQVGNKKPIIATPIDVMVAEPVRIPAPYNPKPYYRAPGLGDAASMNTLGVVDAYLRASDWKTRLPYTYMGNVDEGDIKAYYEKNQDFSFTEYDLKLIDAELDLDQGGPYWVYEIFQDNQSAFPLVIREKAGLLKIDWQVQIEFDDQHFVQYRNSDVNQPKDFRMLVKKLTSYPGSDRVAFKELDQYDCYQLNTPFGSSREEAEYAFVEKGSNVAAKLDKLVQTDSKAAASIVTLDRKNFDHGIRHLIIKDLLREGWLN